MANSKCLQPELSVQDINDFFSCESSSSSHKPVVPQLPIGVYQGRCFDPNPTENEDIFLTTTLKETYDALGDYEEDEETENIEDDPFESLISGDMQNLELESIAPSLLPEYNVLSGEAAKTSVYEHYNFEHEYDKNLPIYERRKEILSTVATNLVTIIQGSTGSGKTTQVPQYILDDYARTGKYCNIVITQPRKIAATSIAHRVCQERKWNIGHVVGYQVGLDKKTSQDTRLTYVTTGVLLRHLIQVKSMNEYTHVILDEVHERDQDTDFAMLLVRKLLWMNSKKVKVILMSATIDTTVFSEYFGTPVGGMLQGAPTITVDGRMFAVEENYIEKIDGLGERPIFDYNNPEISEQAYAIAARLIIHFDKMENDEYAELCSSTSSPPAKPFRGSVLVFLPGIFQIRELEEILKFEKVNKKLEIIPLHSSITLEEQGMVFAKPKPGHRKVILSTNIAESSITVPDIKYVVDFCLTKAMVCDMDTNYQSLRLQWTSQASSRQRSGRAGRVSYGKAYRLVTKDFWMNQLSVYSIPEIQRCSLEGAILKVKILDLGDPRSVLSLALSPPDLHNIERTILLLKEIGALKTSTKQKRLDGDLTFVGRVLAALPIDMRLGKLVMLGFVFGCFSNCLIIAAALSKPSFFASPYNKGVESFRKKLYWAEGSFSDPISLLNAYKAWFKCQETNKFRRKADEREWGKKNYIQIRRIHEVKFQIDELRQRLRHFNIRCDDADHWSTEDPKQCELILKIAMAGAFYPNYFQQTPVEENACVKEMSLLDPSRTVMFNGLPSGKGPLYKDALVHVTKPCGQAKAVYYDGSKAYVEFEGKSDLNTGKVLPAVYLACKMRKEKRRLELHQSYAAKPRDETAGFSRPPPFLYDPILEYKYSRDIPKPGGKMWFPMKITWITSPTQLWGNRLLPENVGYLRKLDLAFRNELSIRISQETLELGMLVMAPFDDGANISYYRALITQLKPMVTVWFVDYGNTAAGLTTSDLRQLPACIQDIPFQAVELRLQGIQRVESRSPVEGEEFLHQLLQTSQYHVQVRVFSVVSNVVAVDLFTREDIYINEILTKQNLCEPMDESKISQLSHASWDTAEKEGIRNEKVFERWHSESWVKVDSSMRGQAVDPSHARICRVHGPRTTFEVGFTSIINIGHLRNVSVDQASINSICITQNVTEIDRSLMMIASEVGINQTGSTMLSRNTTLMPNIKGLCSLISILFAPVVEFRVDSSQLQYTGAICGLGSFVSKSGKCFSVLPDHDIEVSFDTTFDMQDIIDINGLRMSINLAVGNSEKIASWSQTIIHNFQKNARQKLLALVAKERHSVEPVSSRRPFKWRLIAEDDLISPGIEDEYANFQDLYRLHPHVLLRSADGKWQ